MLHMIKKGAHCERKYVSSFGIPKLDIIVIDEINDIALLRNPYWSSNTFMTKEDYKIVNNGVKYVACIMWIS